MAGAAKLRLGSEVVCSDGPAGTLKRFIIDLDTGHVTHLDVGRHAHDSGHLVPITDVSEGGNQVRLSCTSEQFSTLEADEKYGEMSQDPILNNIGLVGGSGLGNIGRPWGPARPKLEQYTPRGEVSVQQHVRARSSDRHHVGQIDGFVVEPSDGHVTHVLLAEGHVFARKHEVAIPADAMAQINEEEVSFSLTKDQIEALPAV